MLRNLRGVLAGGLVLAASLCGCVPVQRNNQYQVGPGCDSLVPVLPVVAANLGKTLTREGSRCVVGGSQVTFGPTAFNITGISTEYPDLLASCIVQEQRIRLGKQERTDHATKSTAGFVGISLVSTLLGERYLEKDLPRCYRENTWFRVRRYFFGAIEVAGFALLIDGDTREAGLYTLAGARALFLPGGIQVVGGFNRIAKSTYAMDLMCPEQFPVLGLKVMRLR